MRLIQKAFIFIFFLLIAAAITLSARTNLAFSGNNLFDGLSYSLSYKLSLESAGFVAPRFFSRKTLLNNDTDGCQIILKLCLSMVNPLFFKSAIGQEVNTLPKESGILTQLMIERQKNKLKPANSDYQALFGAGELLSEGVGIFKEENTATDTAEPKGAYEAFLEENARLRKDSGQAATEFSENILNKEDYKDFKSLYEAFYVLDASTSADGSLLNIDELLGADMRLKSDNGAPQILIYHTHSQEGFMDSLPGEDSSSVVAVGELLTEILTNTYGYNVVHLKKRFDVPDRNQAYAKAEPFLTKFLEDNPSIEVIIDLHRDGVAQNIHHVADLGGQPTAQFMFFNGLSRTKQDGEIGYLPNPNIKGNLAFSFQMQWAANALYPGLTRKIYLKGYRYNMHFREKSLLIELGGQTNTLAEALNTAEPIARLLHEVLG